MIKPSPCRQKKKKTPQLISSSLPPSFPLSLYPVFSPPAVVSSQKYRELFNSEVMKRSCKYNTHFNVTNTSSHCAPPLHPFPHTSLTYSMLEGIPRCKLYSTSLPCWLSECMPSYRTPHSPPFFHWPPPDLKYHPPPPPFFLDDQCSRITGPGPINSLVLPVPGDRRRKKDQGNVSLRFPPAGCECVPV